MTEPHFEPHFEPPSALDWPRLDAIIAEHQHRPGAALPLLHAVQDALGYIPSAAVARLAQALHISRAELHGVISFYHHFRTQPPPRRRVQLCAAEACQSMGGRALWQQACLHAGLDVAAADQLAEQGICNADASLGLQAVYCLGLCACAPAMVVDGQVYGRVQAADMARLLGGVGETV